MQAGYLVEPGRGKQSAITHGYQYALPFLVLVVLLATFRQCQVDLQLVADFLAHDNPTVALHGAQVNPVLFLTVPCTLPMLYVAFNLPGLLVFGNRCSLQTGCE